MKTSGYPSFGAWLKHRRKMLDLTQVELSRQVGCAVVTIQKIEANQRRPSKLMARRLAEQLNIEEQYHPAFAAFARRGVGAHRFAFYQPDSKQDFWPRSRQGWTNLPARLVNLIGREQDLALVRKRLLDEDTRLLTLVGPPGVGKTQLAIQSAASLIGEFEQGVFLVSLASLREPGLVAESIAIALGISQTGERPYAERLVDYLWDKQLLLVLDNFEHLLDAAALISDLLSACSWLSILVTSRAPLSIRGERQFPVQPLKLPPEGKTDLRTQDSADYPAVKLFITRAQDIQPDLTLSESNITTMTTICRRLDGLPLAIELVAARIAFQPLPALLEQLSGSKVLQMHGLRGVSERHRTLYQAIEWSYDLLRDDEKALLARLSVFEAGWTPEAAASLMPDYSPQTTLNALQALADHHLVAPYDVGNYPRYTLLETIRAYALERLAESGEEQQARQRHADYYLALALLAEPELRTSGQQGWLNRLEAERGNLRTALAWFLDQGRDVKKGGLLAGALGWFWNIRCHVSEGLDLLGTALQKCEQGDLLLRCKLLCMIGGLTHMQADAPGARAYYEESIALCRRMSPAQPWELAFALSGFANVVMYQGDQIVVTRAVEESLALFRQVGDPWGTGLAVLLMAEAHLLRHEFDFAVVKFEEGLSMLRQVGDKWAISIALMDLGYTNSLLGNFEIAQTQLGESIVLAREVGEQFMRAYSHNFLAQIAQQQGNAHLAAVHYTESLDLLRKMGLEKRQAEVLCNLGRFVHAHGNTPVAEWLIRQSLALFTDQGDETGIARCKQELAALAG